jgi:hypothetical protein
MNKPYAGMVSEKNEEALNMAIEAIKKSWDIANQEYQKNQNDPRFLAILRSFDAAAYAIQHGRALLRQEPYSDQMKNQAISAMNSAQETAMRYNVRSSDQNRKGQLI